MGKRGLFVKAAQYFIIAVVALISLMVIALFAWFLWAITYGYAVIVILAMLVGIGFGVYQIKDDCCLKWHLKPRIVLLVTFLPMFCFSAFYFTNVLYRIITKEYDGFISGLAASWDIFLSLPVSIIFLATVMLIFLSCIIFGSWTKKSKK